MPAPTEIYVDPAINANSGTGTIGNPYGDLQHALNTATRDATNGNRFNIKAGTAEVLTAIVSLATYGTPDLNAPLIFQGYTAAAGDGGQGDFNGNAGNFSLLPQTAHIHVVDLILRNTGTAQLFATTTGWKIRRCYLHTTTNAQLCNLSAGTQLEDSHIVARGQGVVVTGPANIVGNYFSHDNTGTNKRCIQAAANGGLVIERNVFSIGAFDVDVIYVTERSARIANNSFLGAEATGSAIHGIATNGDDFTVLNNIIEGFSGVGGIGVELDAGSHIGLYAGNAFFNNTINEGGVSGAVFVDEGGNESLASTAYTKSGANSYANRATYYAPLAVGNVRGGSKPTLFRLDKGAIQHADPAAVNVGGIFMRRLG